ncbi:DNA polymerase beta superfamily protein [Phytohabitans suffuscus]|uniref:Uncharacterized protein n=1 Tax=Phytohabitans suffuscus TaxID=624315 RepID=A0A6F8YQ11_9ACTN|nr:nucleotidyltransferase domain-containing protein [Phytohabitans suffuscus]BCB88164.1 hypothetical protein Psuf_054770 [Phytohabitans suffuscus]
MLALQSNPTALEVLWSPLIEVITADGERLLASRRAFLSRRVAETYGNYARDQLARVAARRERAGETNHKQAIHMIRLLVAGAHVLRTEEVLVDVRHLRDRLLAVRRACLGCGRWAADLLAELADAAAATALPERPDREAVDRLLAAVREREPAVTTEVPWWAAEAARALPRPLLTSLAPRLITRHHAHHYLGFAATQERSYAKTGRLEPAMYTLRVPAGAAERLATDVPRLRAELEAARDTSALPDRPDPAAVDALHDLVVRTRLGARE